MKKFRKVFKKPFRKVFKKNFKKHGKSQYVRVSRGGIRL